MYTDTVRVRLSELGVPAEIIDYIGVHLKSKDGVCIGFIEAIFHYLVY